MCWRQFRDSQFLLYQWLCISLKEPHLYAFICLFSQLVYSFYRQTLVRFPHRYIPCVEGNWEIANFFATSCYVFHTKPHSCLSSKFGYPFCWRILVQLAAHTLQISVNIMKIRFVDSVLTFLLSQLKIDLIDITVIWKFLGKCESWFSLLPPDQ